MSYRMARARSIDDWGAPPRSSAIPLPRRPRARWLALAAAGCLVWLWCRNRVPSDLVEAYEARLSRILKHPHTPQKSFSAQLADKADFIISMPFGGQGNQFLAMMNMLFIAKHTNRVAILPPANSDVHFASDLANYSAIYDFPRFYRDSDVMAVQLSQLKTRQDPRNHLDSVQCWSTMEIKTGAANDHQVEAGWNEFAVFTNFWAVPRLPATKDGRATLMDPVLGFLKDSARQEAWLNEVQRDLLPQIGLGGPDVDKTRNVKAGFDPVTATRPTDNTQVMCLDSCFWLGDESPPSPYPQGLPHDAWRVGKAWKEVGRHLHYTEEAERHAGTYLARHFGLNEGDRVPPFIAVHIRRTDFKNFKGNDFTPLAAYAMSVDKVREKLTLKLKNQSRWNKARDRPYLEQFSVPPSEYKVLVATDEPRDSPFRHEIDRMGWVVINHDKFKTVDRLGPWWPSILDSEMLGRAQGFVGTEWSTFSMLAELRVQYWRGGEIETADPKYVPAA